MPSGTYKGRTDGRRPNRQHAEPTHNALHMWLNRNYPKTGVCEHCEKEGKTHRAAKDHSNYTRNPEDYLELCPRCHVVYDDRMPPSRKGTTISAEHIAALQAGRRGHQEAA